RLQIIESLTRLGAKRGVSAAADLLASKSLALRQHVLEYLTATDTERIAMERVVAALSNEPSEQLLPAYVAYFKSNPTRDDAAARALAELAGKNRLAFTEQRDLIRTIGEVAPIGHKPSITTLTAIIEATENAGELEIAAALSLDALGDRDGIKQVDRRLDQLVKRSRNDAEALATRANWERERGEWRAAIRDYESAIKASKSSSSQAMYHLQIARCEAHRGKWSRVRASLKDSGLGRRTIEREAANDPEFAKALEKDTVRKYLESLE
ncbi:MAG: hypothetical protein KDB80_03125, partial [Planctomycetes bacterium]|nr:hypothetical protein [Planctomycetota bacterium]